MIAVIVNTFAIVIGAIIGLFLRRGIPERISDSLMKSLGLVTVVIGLQGTLRTQDILSLVMVTVIGVFIGEYFDLDGCINRNAAKLTAGFRHGDGAKLAEAFVTSCLIMNVGAMVIVGSLDAGLRQNYVMLYTKSLLDFCAAIMMTATMGIGVIGSAAFTFLFQGSLVLMSEHIAPYLSVALIDEMNTVGCLIILVLGLNMAGLAKFKAINYLPMLAVAPLVFAFKCVAGIQ